MTMPMEPEWFSTKAAAQLGVSDRTIYTLMNTGQLRGHRIGRVFRIRDGDLEAFLEESVIKPGDLDHLLPKPPDEA